jgi:hypothetical protein
MSKRMIRNPLAGENETLYLGVLKLMCKLKIMHDLERQQC